MIEDLQAFVAVVEATSLSRAATRLHITQSAVSRRLQQLESRLDGALLDRTHRPPLLTPLGIRVYESARSVLQQVDSLVSLADERAEPSGPFRLGYSMGLGDAVLERIVEPLHAAFPKLQLQVRSDWSPGLVQRLKENDLDATIVLAAASEPLPTSVEAKKIGTVDLVVVQSRQGLSYRRPVPLSALATVEWVLNPTGCGYRAALETAMGRQGPLRAAVDVLGSELQLRLVAKGIGLGLLPRLTLEESPSAPLVQAVNVSDLTLSLDVRLMHRPQAGPLKLAMAALEAYGAAAVSQPGVRGACVNAS